MSCQQVPAAPALNPYPRSVQVGEFEVATDGGIWVAIRVPGKRYKAKDLCGHAYWALLKSNERLLVGSCISHLVRAGELALIKVSEDGTYPNQYVLRVQ
jgi:hypothetical protein